MRPRGETKNDIMQSETRDETTDTKETRKEPSDYRYAPTVAKQSEAKVLVLLSAMSCLRQTLLGETWGEAKDDFSFQKGAPLPYCGANNGRPDIDMVGNGVCVASIGKLRGESN